MDSAVAAVQWAVTAAYLLLGAFALRDWLRHHDARRRSLTLALLLLGLAQLLGRVTAIENDEPRYIQALSILAFLGSGGALLLFRHSFVPYRPATRRIAAVGLVAVTALALATPLPPGAKPTLSPFEYAVALTFVATWLACIAVASSAAVLVVAPLLYVGFAPPRWLRRLWRHREEDAFHEATSELLLHSPNREALARRALEWSVRLVGGEGGVVLDERGAVMAAEGLDDLVVAELVEHVSAAPRRSHLFALQWPGGRHAAVLPLSAPGGSDTLAVVSGPFTPLFGSDELAVLGQYAAALTTALDRTRVVDELSRQTSRMQHQALHDPLTGLPNRTLFNDRLAQALARADHRSSRMALLFLDLDRFKVVNDSLGHDVGDQLLVGVAERLREALRPADTVARFGGDEFVVLCEDIDDEEAGRIADRLTSGMAAPFTVGPREIFVTASVGVTLTDGAGRRGEELVRDADIAMYRAKECGRARVEVFDPAMGASAVDRLDTETSLRRALDHGEFHLLYQPEVLLEDERIVGVEALLRWEHPQRGTIAAAEFIPLAEETGLIEPLGAWVVEEACRQARIWHDLDPERRFSVAVNMSARQVSRGDMVSTVAAALVRNSLPARMLCLEITESAVMADVPRALATLWKLRELGCRLVIDDFGTGFSSLSYLKQFPIAHSLKMDRSFIEGLGQTVDDTAIVRAVVNMAHSLGLSAVAEGVERGDQVAELRSLGCDQAQGFWFGVPMPADTITALLREGEEGVVPHPALRRRPVERHDVAGIEVDGADLSRLAIYSLDAYRGDRPGGRRQPR